MKYKKLLLISGIATVILFSVLVSVTVFRTYDVVVNYSVYTSDETEDVENILSNYKGKNLLFLDANKIAEEITENTNFKVRGVTKKYPYTLVVDLYSEEERFALKEGDSYYVLDVDYVVLKTRDTAINPADGLSDVLLVFNTTETPTVTLKRPLEYANESLFSALKTAISCFESPRDSLYSVTVIETPEKGNYRIELLLRSGVKMQIQKADFKTYEKVSAGISKYRELTDNDLLSGVITCLERDDGQVVATYTKVVVD